MEEALIAAINDLINKSFSQNGGVILDSTGGAVNVVFPNGSSRGTDGTTPPKLTACCFVPDTDGTFGACDSNIKGLGGSIFKAGIPKYFKASALNIATGIGTVYFS